MDRADIERIVLALIHEQKTIDDDALGLDTELSSLGIDSLDALNILFEIEDHFDLTIPDEVSRSLRTADQIVAAIQAQLDENGLS